MDNVKMILRAVLEHKFKFVLSAISAIVFSLLLFPYDDLSDLVTAQISKATNNQIYLQFDRLSVGLMDFGLHLKNVYLETSTMPPISAQDVTLSPSLTGIILKKPAGSISAQGLFKGDIEIKLSPGSKSDTGVQRHKISVVAQKMSLQELKEVLNLPINLKGKVDLSTTALADLALQEQPDMDLNLHVDHFEIPGGNINTMMGPLNLPELKLTSLDLKGRLSAGRFQIEDAQIGREGDDLKGIVKGGIVLQLKVGPIGGVLPQMGSYDFNFDFTVKRSLQDRAALFLSFLDQYKTQTADGARFAFSVSAANPFMPPNLGAAR
jgi:type II secretion system protein N